LEPEKKDQTRKAKGTVPASVRKSNQGNNSRKGKAQNFGGEIRKAQKRHHLPRKNEEKTCKIQREQRGGTRKPEKG